MRRYSWNCCTAPTRRKRRSCPDCRDAAAPVSDIAILIAVIGGGIGSALLLFTPGMTQVLGALALAATNLLCYPFVVAYWLASGKPGLISALLALQTLGVIALLVWCAKLG